MGRKVWTYKHINTVILLNHFCLSYSMLVQSFYSTASSYWYWTWSTSYSYNKKTEIRAVSQCWASRLVARTQTALKLASGHRVCPENGNNVFCLNTHRDEWRPRESQLFCALLTTNRPPPPVLHTEVWNIRDSCGGHISTQTLKLPYRPALRERQRDVNSWDRDTCVSFMFCCEDEVWY